jgi:hypothetical protein
LFLGTGSGQVTRGAQTKRLVYVCHLLAPAKFG